MPTSLEQKSTPDEIRARFDGDIERFSNLDTGQVATIDAPLAMELITQAAVATTPVIRHVLDIGCGAGNNTLKLLQAVGSRGDKEGFDCDLLDLSRPMLDRAQQRVAAATTRPVRTIQADFRAADLPDEAYDVVLAAAVLHHLRDDADWEAAFAKLYRITAPGGSVWITDLVVQETEGVATLMWQRYGDYLVSVGGETYRDQIFATIDREDSPRAVTYQLDLLRQAGFTAVELLHKNSCFAAFGAIKK
jgi:tRNA (cmo5U34)-methyltransferase